MENLKNTVIIVQNKSAVIEFQFRTSLLFSTKTKWRRWKSSAGGQVSLPKPGRDVTVGEQVCVFRDDPCPSSGLEILQEKQQSDCQRSGFRTVGATDGQRSDKKMRKNKQKGPHRSITGFLSTCLPSWHDLFLSFELCDVSFLFISTWNAPGLVIVLLGVGEEVKRWWSGPQGCRAVMKGSRERWGGAPPVVGPENDTHDVSEIQSE